jgi:hypothetical protein
VPLAERVETTSYNWTTASRGATYQFRVIAYSEKPSQRWPFADNSTDKDAVIRPIPSLPSLIAVINTGGQSKKFSLVSSSRTPLKNDMLLLQLSTSTAPR